MQSVAMPVTQPTMVELSPPQLDYKGRAYVGNNNPSYRLKRITPIQGATTITAGAQTEERLFQIPTVAHNWSKSFLCWSRWPLQLHVGRCC
jgi:hypothetical protein